MAFAKERTHARMHARMLARTYAHTHTRTHTGAWHCRSFPVSIITATDRVMHTKCMRTFVSRRFPTPVLGSAVAPSAFAVGMLREIDHGQSFQNDYSGIITDEECVAESSSGHSRCSGTTRTHIDVPCACAVHAACTPIYGHLHACACVRVRLACVRVCLRAHACSHAWRYTYPYAHAHACLHVLWRVHTWAKS